MIFLAEDNRHRAVDGGFQQLRRHLARRDEGPLHRPALARERRDLHAIGERRFE
jgi:hypothetical protein